MKRFIQKTTSIFMSLAMVALIGAPAYAAEAENNDITATPTDPVISEEEILDFIETEEIQDALEDAGVDVEELEEGMENGEVEFIEVPEDELPENLKGLNLFELYGAAVLTAAVQGTDQLTSGLFLIALAPLSLFLWVIPPVGAAYTIAGIPIGIALTLGGAALVVTSPVAGAVMAIIIKFG